MSYKIILAPEAVEDLHRLRAHLRAIIRDALEKHLRHEPNKVSKSLIKRPRGFKRPQYRLRVDNIRVYFYIVEDSVEVLAIVPKSEAQAWLLQQGVRA